MLIVSAAAAISGIGFWIFLRNSIPDYIFFRTPFAFLDYDKLWILVLAENLAMLIAFAFIGESCASVIKIRSSKKSDGKAGLAFRIMAVIASLLICAMIMFAAK